MKLYKEYCKEMYGREVLSEDKGFIVYTSFEDNSLYIHSVYVTEDMRGTNYYRELENKLIQQEKPTSIYCYVDLTTNNPTQSLKAILKAGYEITSSNKESIILKRELYEDNYSRSFNNS